VVADFFECADEGFDVAVGEVLREVFLDGVSVVAAGGFAPAFSRRARHRIA